MNHEVILTKKVNSHTSQNATPFSSYFHTVTGAVLTLQKTHKESGHSHESEGVGAKLGQKRGTHCDQSPQNCRDEQNALSSHSVSTTNIYRLLISLYESCYMWSDATLFYQLICLLVTGMSSQDLCETVTPEESTQNQPRIDLTPVKRGCHWHGTDWHDHPRTVKEASANEQHRDPFLSHGSVSVKWKDFYLMTCM